MTVQEVFVNKKPHRIKILERNGDSFLVEVNEKTVRVKLKNPGQSKAAIIEINGKSLQVNVERTRANILQIEFGGKLFEVQHQAKIATETSIKLEPLPPIVRKPATSLAIEKNKVVAPIAGRIVLLRAKTGQKVERGECVCVLEAMKMENEIAAPKAGVVKEIRVSRGATVNKGDVLAVIT